MGWIYLKESDTSEAPYHVRDEWDHQYYYILSYSTSISRVSEDDKNEDKLKDQKIHGNVKSGIYSTVYQR